MSQPAIEQGHAFCGTVSIKDFTEWLAQFDFEQAAAVFYAQHSLKQRENGVCISAALPAAFALTDWEQGRVFNGKFELRWQVQGDAVNLLLLTEREEKPTACAELCEWREFEANYKVASTRHLLAGTFYRRDNNWFFAEAGVPRAFWYPVDITGLTHRDRAHAVLHGKHYRRGGRTVLTRFTRFRVERERREGGGL